MLMLQSSPRQLRAMLYVQNRDGLRYQGMAFTRESWKGLDCKETGHLLSFSISAGAFSWLMKQVAGYG
jgi:hypothetical protein